ncbi:hypothetical protein DTV22_09640 [Salmonella enterica subsp. enterica serovar Kandla]|nr:hypothetical protein [Salmonella enterica subsp. enterica serovar Kandla]EBX9802988.1 hypothetical protein [Salmonella enterica subsp. enterica serovar Kandla]EBY1903328.1 hypothetical protein [Salmonella enterica subsp. enterica serovar Kandla]
MKDRYVFLTVPRALSRIHRTTKFALKRAAEQQGRLMPPKYTQQCYGPGRNRKRTIAVDLTQAS